jgi:hypothetical protein
MAIFSESDALKSYWEASPAIRQVILAEARLCASARQAAMVALEQRVAQAVAALFAAAAFSATFALTFRHTGAAYSALGGLATIAFTVGALVSLGGMAAGDIIFPGASPSWWAAHEFLSNPDPAHAEYWLAGQLELTIESYDAVARRRADHLNLGLRYGIAGGVFVAIAGALAIFG